MRPRLQMTTNGSGHSEEKGRSVPVDTCHGVATTPQTCPLSCDYRQWRCSCGPPARALSAEAHALARHLGLSGRRSVVLVVGCGNALVLTALGQGPVTQATWSAAAAALILLGVLGWFSWSAWRDQDS